MFMNEYDIEMAARRAAPASVAGIALRYLRAHVDAVNAQSDGFAHWRPSTAAARRMMELASDPQSVDMRALGKALAVLRTFYSRHPQLARPDVLAVDPRDMRSAGYAASFGESALRAGPL